MNTAVTSQSEIQNSVSEARKW